MSSDELIEAIENGDLNDVKDLVEQQGVNVNTESETSKVYPIIMAFERGEHEIVDYLLSKGADVNVREENGATVLLKALDDWNDLEDAKKIIRAGANLNFLYKNEYDQNDDELKSVLMIASSRLEVPFVQLFLNAKADVNLRSSKGKTALMFAAQSVGNNRENQLKILRYLINYASHFDLTDNEGRTALDLCSNDECKQLIQQEIMERERGSVRERMDVESEDDEYREEDDAMDMLDDEVPEDGPEFWTAEELFSYDKAVYSVAFDPERTEFMVGNTILTLPSLFQHSDLITRQLMTEPFSTSVHEAVYTPDGQFVVLAAKRFGAVVKSRQQQDDVRFFNENGSEVTCVDVSPDSKKFVSASKDKIIRLWDIETGSLIRRFSDHKDNRSNIERVRFSPDGEHFASVADDIIIWSMARGHMKTIKGNGEDKLTTFAYSPDGNRIASLAGTNCFVWNVKNQLQLAFDLSGNGRELSEVAFTPDGKYILLARDEDAEGNNATINVCDALSGDLLAKLDGGINYIFSIAISKDNQFVLIGGRNEDEKGEVLFGKMSELLKPLATPPFPKQLEQTQLNVEQIQFTQEPDIFDVLMVESYPLSDYQSKNPESIVFLTNTRNGFGYDRDQLRSMTIGAEDYYFKCLNLNERLVVALSNVAGETPYVLLRSAGTYYVPAEQLEAALDDEHSIFMLKEYDVLPYTASIGVIEVSHAQRNHRGEQINVVSKDHCQAGSNKKAYEIIALDVQ